LSSTTSLILTTPRLNDEVVPPIKPEEELKRNNLIYAYFLESTGLVEVFRKLFTSFLTSDDVLKLNRQDDSDLIETLKEIMNLTFAKSASSITPDLEELRLNAYWRLFGYTIKGKENFPRARGYNAEFNKTFESIMVNIFQLILDRGITIEKMGNPNALATDLDSLQKQLNTRTYNTIEDISQQYAEVFYALVLLLGNNKLMNERLNVRSEDPARRLIELGQNFKVAVAKETSYLFLLASRMNIFLRKIEEVKDWTPQKARELVETADNEVFFKEIQSAWAMVTGTNFLEVALRARRSLK
jgi:hypothetical protein